MFVAATAFLSMSCKDPGFKTVGPEEFAELLKDTTVQLLDVRTPEEYAKGFIPGAILIDVKESGFMDQVRSQLSADRPVAVYCRSGRRSAAAAAELVKAGYKVTNLGGGILAWESRYGLKGKSPQKP